MGYVLSLEQRLRNREAVRRYRLAHPDRIRAKRERYVGRPVVPHAPLLERFWAKVQKSDDCWEWQGARGGGAGYGHIHRGTRLIKAHRVSWEIHNGPIPPGLHVCHRCDNPPCVRPDHLFLGTRSDNMRDAARKGRLSRPPEQMRAMRARQLTAPSHVD